MAGPEIANAFSGPGLMNNDGPWLSEVLKVV